MKKSDTGPDCGSLGIVLLLLIAGIVLASGVFAAMPNHPPLLKSPLVNPYNSTDKSHYRFSVLYSDPDGDLPKTIQVVADGKTYDLKATGGKRYNTSYVSPVIAFEPGAHKYSFACEDARGLECRSPRYGEWTGPYVAPHLLAKRYNSWPELAEGKIVQGEDGDIETYFTYTVNFSDYDSTPPQAVVVVIDGLEHPMKLLKGTAWNGRYIYNAYMDTAPHAFWFRARDARGAEVTLPEKDFTYGPTVYDLPNANPELTDMSVSPEIGPTSEPYAFSARYHDIDKDPPAIIQVYVDGFPHNMKLASGRKYDGVYRYKTSMHPSNYHTYSFRAEDGRGGEVTQPFQGTIHGPVVADQR
jgi:hypothetical protein